MPEQAILNRGRGLYTPVPNLHDEDGLSLQYTGNVPNLPKLSCSNYSRIILSFVVCSEHIKQLALSARGPYHIT